MKSKEIYKNEAITVERQAFYQQACIIKKLLQRISPGSHWMRELYVLISEYKHFPIWQMGFLEDWENDPFWKDL